MHPSEHTAAGPAHLSAAEVERVWRAELPNEDAKALDEALAREPSTRPQLALALARVDEETRAIFVRALARVLASSRPPRSLEQAVEQALARTRIAVFWLSLEPR